MMEQRNADLKAACLELETIIEKNKIQLDSAQKQLESRDPGTSISRLEIEKATAVAAIETMKHSLATLQGRINASACQYAFHSTNLFALNNLARAWQTKSITELQECLMEEKRKQTVIAEQINKKKNCLNENKKLQEVLLQEKRNLENKESELENEKVAELEEKLAKVKRLYGEMKTDLKNTVETYFPDPKIPGYTGMYSLLNELTQRLQNRERDAYIEIPKGIWPYYLETLENHGIIERHSSDHQKIRIIDFSDGRLGSEKKSQTTET